MEPIYDYQDKRCMVCDQRKMKLGAWMTHMDKKHPETVTMIGLAGEFYILWMGRPNKFLTSNWWGNDEKLMDRRQRVYRQLPKRY